jgi:hypothetical protein
MAYENLIVLNGLEITDQGRTLNESREERAVAVQLANGNIKKYVMGEKHRWSLAWTWLPHSAALTHDGYAARDSLRALAYTGNSYTLTIKNTVGQTNSYTVFIESYEEELVRRDTVNNQFFYNVSIELMEQ